MICPGCSGELAGGATFCPVCRERGQQAAAGSPVAGARVRAVAPAVTQGNDPRERFFLITACLFSAGALAVPRLLRSKAFGPVGKTVLGTIAIGQTLCAVAIVVTIPWWFPVFSAKVMKLVEEQQGLTRGY